MASGVTTTSVSGDGAVPVGPDGQQTLYGLTFHSPAFAGQLSVREGDASGRVLDVVRVAIDGQVTHWFGPQGLRVDGDIFVDTNHAFTATHVMHG